MAPARPEATVAGHLPDRYKWIALSNTTLGMLLATINSSIVFIALPDIFNGIRLNPLQPGNTGYLLWMMTGFMVVTAVLVVTFGRLGDRFGRVRMYNLGFVFFTVCSILLSVTWMTGADAARWLIGWRIAQGIGAAFLIANSTAIVTDVFPANQRGTAIGINSIAAIAGSFIGLLLGGLLAPHNWHLVFVVSVPAGVIGTAWAFLMLRETSARRPVKPVPPAVTAAVYLPALGVLSAVFLGYNPVRSLLGPLTGHRPAADVTVLTGHSFFPRLTTQPFHDGLVVAFWFAIAASVIAAAAAVFTGKRQPERTGVEPSSAAGSPAATREPPEARLGCAGTGEAGARESRAAEPETEAETEAEVATATVAETAATATETETVVAGVVTGPDGAPAAGAAVTALDAANTVAGSAVTGADGGYRLPVPGPGYYVVVAAGLRSQMVTLHAQADADAAVVLRIGARS